MLHSRVERKIGAGQETKRHRACLKVLFRFEISQFRARRGRTTQAYMKNVRQGGRTKPQPKLENCSRKEDFLTRSGIVFFQLFRHFVQTDRSECVEFWWQLSPAQILREFPWRAASPKTGCAIRARGARTHGASVVLRNHSRCDGKI